MNKLKNRVGEKYLTNEGCWATIIEYFGCNNVTILFEDGTILNNRLLRALKKGSVKNPNHLSVCGVGYLGIGNYMTTHKSYDYWQGMIRRCYDSEFHKKQPRYIEVTPCEEWKCFQNFAEWFVDNYTEKYCLDKDILSKGNKIYSPETCCFVPNEINMLFVKCDKSRGKYPIGVQKSNSRYKASLRINGKIHQIKTCDTIQEAFEAYKTVKEMNIKNTANEWKGRIKEKVYQALMKYQVEITD